MAKDYFEFKQFVVNQDKCAMKVGTDSVLLGGWVAAEGNLNILDIGAGTGILSLMLAQKTIGIIDAIELDEQAALQAEENFSLSTWRGRLNCYNQSLQEFARTVKKRYDLIISNPPYFSIGIRSDESNRALARHTDSLSYNELVSLSRKLLKPTGRFTVIVPNDTRRQMIRQFHSNEMWVMREARIRPKENMEFNRVLFECALKMPAYYSIEEIIVEEKNRYRYHRSFKKYTKDYYLDF